MSSISVNTITDASGGSTTTINGLTPSVSNMAGRNRIINGGMVFDQRNNGAAVTPSADPQYTLDRWVFQRSQASKFSTQQNAGSVTPPNGFSNYLGITSLSAYSIGSSDYFLVQQKLEGFNTADLAWGTANAKTVTVSFWVRSSLTGTFGGAVRNSAENRSYPFSYTISVADTWEQKSITIAGDTTGTWVGATNGIGLSLAFGFGVGSTYSGTAGSWAGANYASATGATSVVGTSGATFYITGVQLEEGSVATPFEHRQYGQELALCQRYFEKLTVTKFPLFPAGNNGVNSEGRFPFHTQKRAAPTVTKEGDMTLFLNGSSSVNTDHALNGTVYGAGLLAVIVGGSYSASTGVDSVTFLANAEL